MDYTAPPQSITVQEPITVVQPLVEKRMTAGQFLNYHPQTKQTDMLVRSLYSKKIQTESEWITLLDSLLRTRVR